MLREKDALDYHSAGRPGKLEVVPSKSCISQRDLSLAYTPGVAVPCERIAECPEDVFQYTGRGNLVAVISNGTAVLGLGDIGPEAGKPVMEGKALLFKRFADIDVFDLEIASHDAEEIIRFVKMVEPTFGGINLEDIKAPECFQIEEALCRDMDIPVFHDDQHGTAIISGAGLLNALEIVGKQIEDVRVVFNGAGAAGIACAKYYITLGVRPENLVLCDSQGVVHTARENLNPYKRSLANDTPARTLAEAAVGADVLVGLSVAGCFTTDMLRSMADDPIVFAMANPTPEISYPEAKAARQDVIMATGRSDYPNQVNNVLGFPFIFRGALDTRATSINDEMKLAATRALAALAKEDVPDAVCKAYGERRIRFGRDYLIPKPFDPRVLIWEAAAVAQAAMESGVARREVDLEIYREQLERRLGKARSVMRMMINEARRRPKRVVFPEGENEQVLRAAQIILDEEFAVPVLLGNEQRIRALVEEAGLHLETVEIVEPDSSPRRSTYQEELVRRRRRKGVTMKVADELLGDATVFGAMMVELGDADALVAGVGQHYPDTLRPALQVIGIKESVTRVAGVHMLFVKDRVFFLADTTVNIEPTAEELAEIAIGAAEVAREFHVEPRVAMLSFSNFGSVKHPFADKVKRATELVKQRCPGLEIDGEMQIDAAVMPELIEEFFPFSSLKHPANVLVFPELQSANLGYKLLQRLGGAEAVGPILMGIRKPVHLLQHGCDVRDIVNMAAIAAVGAQRAKGELPPAAPFERPRVTKPEPEPVPVA
jgi:malate dehydrogenase (oxaloacetate-decarboxylating)(NADP+)